LKVAKKGKKIFPLHLVFDGHDDAGGSNFYVDFGSRNRMWQQRRLFNLNLGGRNRHHFDGRQFFSSGCGSGNSNVDVDLEGRGCVDFDGSSGDDDVIDSNLDADFGIGVTCW
jgi:hypothetical protein